MMFPKHIYMYYSTSLHPPPLVVADTAVHASVLPGH